MGKASAKEITEAMSEDPMIGMLLLLVTAKIGASVEIELFGDR